MLRAVTLLIVLASGCVGTAGRAVEVGYQAGYLAEPQQHGEYPACLLVPGPWGVTDAVKERCLTLAGLGFVALAIRLHEEGAPDSDKEVVTRYGAADVRTMVGRIREAIHYLVAERGVKLERIGIVGFDAGGSWAAKAITSGASSRAAALVTLDGPIPAGHTAIPAHVLVVQAAGVDPAERAEEFRVGDTAARRREILVIPNAASGFADPDRGGAFNTVDAEVAWQRAVDFLRTSLK